MQKQSQESVEEILNSRIVKDSYQYLVKWVNCDKPTWKPLVDISKFMTYVLEYERKKREKQKKVVQQTKIVEQKKYHDEKNNNAQSINLQQYQQSIQALQLMQQEHVPRTRNRGRRSKQKERDQSEVEENTEQEIEEQEQQCDTPEENIKRRLRGPEVRIIEPEQFKTFQTPSVVLKPFPKRKKLRKSKREYKCKIQYIEYTGKNQEQEHTYQVMYNRGKIFNYTTSEMRQKNPIELIEYLERCFLD